MKYSEAVKNFNNSRRKLAEALGLSTQAVDKWAKFPDKPIPKKRIEMVKKMIEEKSWYIIREDYIELLFTSYWWF